MYLVFRGTFFLLICTLFVQLPFLQSQRIPKTEGLCICMEEITSNLTKPLIIENAGDASDRLFVGEQGGVIYVLNRKRTLNKEPFLDISEQVMTGGERGLLGLTFHPNYEKNRRFFVYYSTKSKDLKDDHVTRLCEFKTSGTNPNKADKSSEKLILELAQPYSNHNGGQLLFGNDGYLYVFTGDGGSAGDPEGYAQNTSSLLGKVLRIDVDKTTSGKRYSIPKRNPFVNNRKFRPEIYAYGLRNPWRCGKHPGRLYRGKPSVGGWIFCGDVGQDKYEEVDFIQYGANYGWNAEEGDECYSKELCGKIGKTEPPVSVYPHEVGSSIIGGQFYRGCENPRLRRYYIFGDYVSGKLFVSEPTRNLSMWRTRELSICTKCNKPLTNKFETSFTSFGLDEYGELFVTAFGNPGKLYKIVDPYTLRRHLLTRCRVRIQNLLRRNNKV